MAGRIWRVADDDSDVAGLLAQYALVVGREDRIVERVVVFVHLECVCEHDSFEWRIHLRVRVVQAVERCFDVDRCDVVGKQVDFVGVQLGRVFAQQVVGTDQT